LKQDQRLNQMNSRESSHRPRPAATKPKHTKDVSQSIQK